MPTSDEDVQSNGTSTIGTLRELLILVHSFDSKGNAKISAATEKQTEKKDDHSDYALVLRRFNKPTGELEKEQVDINSPYMLRFLSEIATFYPSVPTTFTQKLSIEAPYKFLYHHWNKISDCWTGADDETSMHLKSLITFWKASLDKKKAELKI
ncbi:Similar to hypothetical protein FOXB_05516 [Fusarium oxysporum Fo5176]; acc. no. EGU83970 [Pyronema omphalodes CBS 100304]|uniref:Uncharacterized protein n=1 Tax=Pyronema omphalodes (strain CBS 100304) TaxID=1076935 RepID=U4LIJ0_PYROM|nr:Similar to hypothetical protein FOXB_05516 [Fusarium oxysporum Fo5176]; acc. no. EGU83970 [Pyronema omphalodes CBS 100304]